MVTQNGVCGQCAAPHAVRESKFEVESATHLRHKKEERTVLDWDRITKQRNAMMANAHQVLKITLTMRY